MSRKKTTKSKASSWNNKISKYLVKLRQEQTQVANIRNERGNITTNHMEIKTSAKKYYEQLFVHKFESLGEVNQFFK
jgi:hypothetical protein